MDSQAEGLHVGLVDTRQIGLRPRISYAHIYLVFEFYARLVRLNFRPLIYVKIRSMFAHLKTHQCQHEHEIIIIFKFHTSHAVPHYFE